MLFGGLPGAFGFAGCRMPLHATFRIVSKIFKIIAEEGPYLVA